MTPDQTGLPVDLADVQGNILRGYRQTRVRHLVIEVVDARAARSWIAATAGSDRSLAPAITSAAHWGDDPPAVCFNLGVTYAGLMALGVPEATKDKLVESIVFPKRMGRPEEFALLVESIIQNPYLNGENIRLDGALRFPPK